MAHLAVRGVFREPWAVRMAAGKSERYVSCQIGSRERVARFNFPEKCDSRMFKSYDCNALWC